MENDSKKATMIENFLFGFFNQFINLYEEDGKSSKNNSTFFYCYMQSLLKTYKFKKIKEVIDNIDNTFDNTLILLYLKLYFLDHNPKFYFSEFNNKDDKYDIFENFFDLFKQFMEWFKNNEKDEWTIITDILVLKTCNHIYSLAKEFNQLNDECIKITQETVVLLKKIEKKYIDFLNYSNKDTAFEFSEILRELGYFYEIIEDYEKNYQTNKIIEYYKKSLEYSDNIFTTIYLTNFYIALFKKENTLRLVEIAKEYLDEFDKKLSEKYGNENEPEYVSYFDVKADIFFYYRDIVELEKENYRKAFRLIEKTNYHNINDSDTYYNMGVTERDNKQYVASLGHFKKALEIFCGCYPDLNINEIGQYMISKSKIHKISDLEDYLYVIYETQILKCEKEVECVKRINIDLLERLSVYDDDMQILIAYDIVLLKFKKNLIIKKYRKAEKLITDFLENKNNNLTAENKADLAARLAHIYFITKDFEKSKEKLEEAIDYDSENEYILKFIAQRDTFQNNFIFLSKEHIHQLSWTFIISFAIIIFFAGLIFLLGWIGSLKNILDSLYNPTVFILLFFSFIIPIFVTFFYPLLKKIMVGNIQLEFFDVTEKERKM